MGTHRALMPEPGWRGRPRELGFRAAINAMRHLVRSGGGWRMLLIHVAIGRRFLRGNAHT